jgi:hypothetical protein
MKNVKNVKQPNGKRLKIQKRLLLINIKELYDEYKKKYSSAVCKLSVFFENRPVYVINVGATGHIPCVCVFTTRTLNLCWMPQDLRTKAIT